MWAPGPRRPRGRGRADGDAGSGAGEKGKQRAGGKKVRERKITKKIQRIWDRKKEGDAKNS